MRGLAGAGVLFLVATASGQDPEASDTDAAPAADAAPADDAEVVASAPAEPFVSDEVIVYGEALIEAARQDVIEEAAKDGYIREIRKDDRTILRHELPWKGDVVLFDDGRLDIKRQPVRFEPPTERKTAASYLWCVLLVPCIRPAGQTVSKRKFEGYKRTVMARIEPEVRVWNERISDYALDKKVDGLPAKLEALWETGRALDGSDEVFTTHAARRRALFDYWDSRTDTPWGHEVKDAVAAFVRGVVQGSEHPFGAAELAALDAQRTTALPFPVEAVGP